jgi:ELWxxDGT repeat protein
MAALDYFFGQGFRFFLFLISGLFFCAGSGAAQPTPLVPYQVKDINPGSGDSGPYNFVSLGKTLYFNTTEQSGSNLDFEYWKSDGTSEGTSLVKDIRATGDARVQYLTRLNYTTILFSANNGLSGAELWKSDGTETGTTMVYDINPAGASFPSFLFVNGQTLYFTANDGVHGYELWALQVPLTIYLSLILRAG